MTPTDAYRMLRLAHCGFYPHRFLIEHLLYKWNIQKLQKYLCMTLRLSGHLEMAVRTQTRNMNMKFDDGRGDLADRGEHWCSCTLHRDPPWTSKCSPHHLYLLVLCCLTFLKMETCCWENDTSYCIHVLQSIDFAASVGIRKWWWRKKFHDRKPILLEETGSSRKK